MKTQMEYSPAAAQALPPRLMAAFGFIALCNNHMGFVPFGCEECGEALYQGLEEEQQTAFDLACWEVQKYFKPEKGNGKGKRKAPKRTGDVRRAPPQGGEGSGLVSDS
jgi:hypothetical protein